MQEKHLGVIVIPHWLKALLEAQGVALAQLTQYDALRDALTYEQRLLLLMAQDLRVGLFSANDLQAEGQTLTNQWFNSTTEYEHEIAALIKDAHARASAGFNLYQALELDLPEPPTPQANPVTLDVLDVDGTSLVALLVSPGVSRIDVPQYYEAVQSLIERFYTYETPYKVSTYRIFNTYLTLMAKNRQVA